MECFKHRENCEKTELTFLVLNLGLNVLDAIGRFDLEGDGLPREGFDEDLHRDLDSVVRDENKIDC